MKQIFKKNSFFSSYKIFFVIFLLLFCIGFLTVNPIKSKMEMVSDVKKYINAEKKPTHLPSRMWMNVALEDAMYQNHLTREDFAPSVAARFYAYVASIYSDVLEKTNDSDQASIATAALIKVLTPNYSDQTDQYLKKILKNKKASLSSESKSILNAYIDRSNTDNYSLDWTHAFPRSNDTWFTRNGKRDKGARAGEWKRWILSDMDEFSIPPPPKQGSLQDILEIERVIYASYNRSSEDPWKFAVWAGSANGKIVNGKAQENITPPGVWMNIFFIEEGDRLSDKEYARGQKILAQSTADSFYYTWKVKYDLMVQRPSMRIPQLNSLVLDPPFPSYTSGHSTTSHTAGVVLSHFFPEKAAIWQRLASDARNSRLNAGIHFDSDQQIGEYLGKNIGEKILQRLDSSYKPKDHSHLLKKEPTIIQKLLVWFMRAQPVVRASLAQTAEKLTGIQIARLYAIDQKGVGQSSNENLFQAATWTDFNNDGYLDLYADGNIFKNVEDNHFEFVTTSIGLRNFHNVWGIRVFGDYNNDNCPDVFEGIYAPGDTSPIHGEAFKLYKNTCSGFIDVTKQVGLDDKEYFTKGAAWGDYNNDGYLDIYIANHGTPEVNKSQYEPNFLYKNNGNGTFTNVTQSLHVTGIGECPGKKSNFKPSAQPIWLDFNNDLHIDLFVLNSDWISVLYKNNGNGTFTDITNNAGLCTQEESLWAEPYFIKNSVYPSIKIYTHSGSFILHNNGNETFTKQSEQIGFTNEEFENQALDQNINNELSSLSPPDAMKIIFSRIADSNRWTTIQLVGTKSNKDALGASVTVKSGSLSQTKQVTNFSSFEFQLFPWLIFPLSSTGIADSIEIRWPSGKTQVKKNISGNQIITITEAP